MLSFESLESRDLLTSVVFNVPDPGDGHVTNSGNVGDVINSAGAAFVADGINDMTITFEEIVTDADGELELKKRVFVIPGDSYLLPPNTNDATEYTIDLQPFNAGDGERLPFDTRADDGIPQWKMDLNGDGENDSIFASTTSVKIEYGSTLPPVVPTPPNPDRIITFVDPIPFESRSYHIRGLNVGDVINSAGSEFVPDGIDDLFIIELQLPRIWFGYLIPGGSDLLTPGTDVELAPFLAGHDDSDMFESLPFWDTYERKSLDSIDLNGDGQMDEIVQDGHTVSVIFAEVAQQGRRFRTQRQSRFA